MSRGRRSRSSWKLWGRLYPLPRTRKYPSGSFSQSCRWGSSKFGPRCHGCHCWRHTRFGTVAFSFLQQRWIGWSRKKVPLLLKNIWSSISKEKSPSKMPISVCKKFQVYLWQQAQQNFRNLEFRREILEFRPGVSSIDASEDTCLLDAYPRVPWPGIWSKILGCQCRENEARFQADRHYRGESLGFEI